MPQHSLPMQIDVQPAFVSPESLARKHEAGDPRLQRVWIAAGGVVLMMACCFAVSGLLMICFAHQRRMQAMQPLGIISAPDLKPLDRFPRPNLEIDDGHAQMASLRARQIEELNGYGWIDRSNGVVRIPIARAVELILQRGLPARTNGVSRTGVSPLRLIQQTAQQR